MSTINTATYKPRVKRGSKPYLYHIESATRPGTYHTVDAYRMVCSCEAGRNQKRCWHLALAIQYDGWRQAQQAKATPTIKRPVGMAALHEVFS